MGLMRFVVPNRERLPAAAVSRAFLTGRDDIPWKADVAWAGDQIVLDREEHESGVLNILWTLGGWPILLSTGTLVERPEPYNLPVELARGTINRVRNYLAALEVSGAANDTIAACLKVAVPLLAQSVTLSVDPHRAADLAQSALEEIQPALDQLAAVSAELSFQLRRKQLARNMVLMGVSLGNTVPSKQVGAEVATNFTAGKVSCSWRHIEGHEGHRQWNVYDTQLGWLQSTGLRTFGGPLLDFHRRSIPDWLYLWEGNFDGLMNIAGDFVGAVVQRYVGKVQLWNCAARINTGDALDLTDEQRLRLTARALEVTRAIDGRSPLITTFDQPWGEYLAERELDMAPLHLADALVRAELGLAGIGLEMNFGCGPADSLLRDPLDVGRLIDRWSQLGLPLILFLTVPGGPEVDELAATGKTGSSLQPQFDAEFQRLWVERYMPTLLSRPAVQAIIWNDLRDSRSGKRGHRGLLASDGTPKPALTALTAIRKQCGF